MSNSNYEYIQVVNGNGAKSLIRSNIYYAKVFNDTAFEIILRDTRAGDLVVPAGKERIIARGHPNYPGEVNVTVVFNIGHSSSDFITFVITERHGSDIRKC